MTAGMNTRGLEEGVARDRRGWIRKTFTEPLFCRYILDKRENEEEDIDMPLSAIRIASVSSHRIDQL